MAYVTYSQIVTRLGNDTALRLTTETDGSSVDTAMITTIITEVEGTINMALRSRTATSITQATHPQSFAMLRGFATSMVICRLGTRRPPVPPDWQKANDRAEEWLKKLADGTVNLPDATLNEPGADWGSHDQDAAAQR